MFYLPLTIVLLLPFIAFANEMSWKAKMAHPFKRTGVETKDSKLKLQNIVGSFPTNPTYFSMKTYDDATCTTLNGANSYLLNTCYTSGTISEQYTCSGGTLTWTQYSDAACTTSSSVTTATSSCSAGGGGYGIVTDCGGSSAGEFGGTFINDNFYETNSCSNEIVGIVGYPNHVCFDNGDGTSTYITWPNVKQYATSTCTGTVTEVDAIEPRTCTLYTSGGGTDDTLVGSYEMITYNSATTNKVLGFGFVAFVALAMGFLF